MNDVREEEAARDLEVDGAPTSLDVTPEEGQDAEELDLVALKAQVLTVARDQIASRTWRATRCEPEPRTLQRTSTSSANLEYLLWWRLTDFHPIPTGNWTKFAELPWNVQLVISSIESTFSIAPP